ncbi:hypothetical protein Tco_1072949 [Tanacetum coccineum]
MAPLPAADQRHLWLRYQIEEYTKEIRRSYKQRLKTIWSRPVNRVHVLDFEGLTAEMRMSDTIMDLDTADTLYFQLGGVSRRMTWRQFILALGLHTKQEMAEAGDFLAPSSSYVLIRDSVRRLCHRMIAYSISGRGQALEKVTGVDLFYLRNMDRRTANVLHLLAQYLLVSDDGLRGLQVVTRELPLIDLHELGRLHICTRYGETWTWVAHRPERQQATAAGVDEAGPVAEEVAPEIPAPAQAPPPAPQPRDVASFTIEQSRVSTWLISCITQLMDASGQTYQPFDSTLVESRLAISSATRPLIDYRFQIPKPLLDRVKSGKSLSSQTLHTAYQTPLDTGNNTAYLRVWDTAY